MHRELNEHDFRKYVGKKLGDLRQKLLDLTTSNSLVSFKFRTNSVRVVDELPNQVSEYLLTGKSMNFEPVPLPSAEELEMAGFIVRDADGEIISQKKPTAKEWAAHLGIETSYEVPGGAAKGSHHEDGELQTLDYHASLEARLSKARQSSKEALNEVGCNVLFLVLGFLEWYESEDSDRSHLAPLYSLAVDLERDRPKSGAYRYYVKSRGEDLFSNVTLQEKLAVDFGLVLPEIDSEDSPETYFSKIESHVLTHQPRWKLRRNVTLTILDFKKQAMYADLDPERWLGNDSILDHEIIQKFFSAEEDEEKESGIQSRAHTVSIDSVDDVVDRYPIVYDADSSQHAAIIDALDGKNLVIEGPPGTGKSQTIANLICAALSRNKRVLFVAEKLAALEVVKSRLDAVGLGEFCLELHGHTSRKSEVINRLGQRLKSKFSNPSTIETEKKLQSGYLSTLNKHADLVNEYWRNSGKTIHAILSAAVRYSLEASELGELPVLGTVKGESFGIVEERDLLEKCIRAAKLHQNVSKHCEQGKLSSHCWHGLRQVSLLKSGIEDLISELNTWNRWLIKLDKVLVSYQVTTSLSLSFGSSLGAIEGFMNSCKALPELTGEEVLSALPFVVEENGLLYDWLARYRDIEGRWPELKTCFKDSAIQCEGTSKVISKHCNSLQALGCSPVQNSEYILEAKVRADSLVDRIVRLAIELRRVKEEAPSEFFLCLTPSKMGLEELLTASGHVDSLSQHLWPMRDSIFDNGALDELIPQIKKLLGEIRGFASRLAGVFELQELPSARQLRADAHVFSSSGMLGWMKSSFRVAKKRLVELLVGPHAKKGLSRLSVNELAVYAAKVEELIHLHSENPALGHYFAGVNTQIEKIEQLRQWYKAVREEYGFGFQARTQIAEALFKQDRRVCSAIGELRPLVKGILSEIKVFESEFSKLNFETSTDISSEEGALTDLQIQLAEYCQIVVPLLVGGDCSMLDLQSFSDKLARQQRLVSDWASEELSELVIQNGFSFKPRALEQPIGVVVALERTLEVAKTIVDCDELKSVFEQSPTAETYSSLQSFPEVVWECLSNSLESQKLVQRLGDLDLKAWNFNCKRLEDLVSRNKRAVASPEHAEDWLRYLRAKQSILSTDLEQIIKKLEENGLTAEQTELVIRASIYRQLSNEILTETPELDNFYGYEQEGVVDQFQVCDKKLMALKREEIAYMASRGDIPAGKKGGKVGELTERNLITHEAQKKKRHIPLRDLLDRAGDAVRAITPCFMMSPMSVATYLKPGMHTFDYVIMDEASQIRPEDALGSIARGETLVVVGDPKQLPPTNVFRKLTNEDSDDEERSSLEDSESILDSVSSMFPVRRLSWHYRSRHVDLISFSASNFYDNGLVLFPSPFEVNPEFGLKFQLIEDGFLESKVNKPEARAVVELLFDHMQQNSGESIGIVSMNSDQRDFIVSEVEDRLKEDLAARKLYETFSVANEEVFFKNLENVQGDERDVIVISMTYGPVVPNGPVAQRFQQIIQEGGGRRLNVLLTRARKRMHVLSSITATDVQITGKSSEGKKTLRRLLEFCEKRPESVSIETGKEPDSDFEIAVIAALTDRGYVCSPQVGVAGYFIDIAVRDPLDHSRYLLAVECDGATYHSAKSARDRDRLRQEVLENLGWNVIRIWSTDWFLNPKQQIDKVVIELERLSGSDSRGGVDS